MPDYRGTARRGGGRPTVRRRTCRGRLASAISLAGGTHGQLSMGANNRIGTGCSRRTDRPTEYRVHHRPLPLLSIVKRSHSSRLSSPPSAVPAFGAPPRGFTPRRVGSPVEGVDLPPYQRPASRTETEASRLAASNTTTGCPRTSTPNSGMTRSARTHRRNGGCGLRFEAARSALLAPEPAASGQGRLGWAPAEAARLFDQKKAAAPTWDRLRRY